MSVSVCVSVCAVMCSYVHATLSRQAKRRFANLRLHHNLQHQIPSLNALDRSAPKPCLGAH